MKKKILVIAPSFPIPETGAEQADRAAGFRQLVRLGYEVSLISKVTEWADLAFVQSEAKKMGIRVTTIPYRYSNRSRSFIQRCVDVLGRFRNPLFLDGAAYEYAEPAIRTALLKELETFKPDIVWFEYTYLWPLYTMVRVRGIPIVTRSVNFEPEHFLEEDGRTFFNYIKYIPKWIGEKRILAMSNLVFAITPKEKKIYANLGAHNVSVLPLRSLPTLTQLARPNIVEHTPLHVVFMGSSYSVSHNRAAAAFLIQEIIPQTHARAPGAFVFHIAGAKLPDTLQKKVATLEGCIYEGYVQNLTEFLSHIDIAVVPSLYGAGMQQKVFEPITRGIPTVTSPRAVADYAFKNTEHYMGATTASEFVDALCILTDTQVRAAMSASASAQAKMLFSENVLDAIVQDALEKI